MAKTPGTKADAIRAILTANPTTKTNDVVAKLAQNGLQVSPNHVYLIKSKMKSRKRRQVRANAAALTQRNGTPNAATAVSKVKLLARELGGLKNLKDLVEVLSE
jgi:chemotaxis response regulator CheB